MQVNIIEGCITCGVCETLCPEVFQVIYTARADNSQIPGHELECRQAAAACPVNVIKIAE